MSGLDDLERLIGKLSTSLLPLVKAEASTEIAETIKKEFRQGLGPYGYPWHALSRTTLKGGRHPPPLTDTGAMRDGVEVKPGSGNTVTVDIPADYASYHQYGTKNADGSVRIPRRPMLPEAGNSESWDESINKSIDTAIGKILK